MYPGNLRGFASTPRHPPAMQLRGDKIAQSKMNLTMEHAYVVDAIPKLKTSLVHDVATMWSRGRFVYKIAKHFLSRRRFEALRSDEPVSCCQP